MKNENARTPILYMQATASKHQLLVFICLFFIIFSVCFPQFPHFNLTALFLFYLREFFQTKNFWSSFELSAHK